MIDITPIWLSLKLSVITTIILLAVSLPVAGWLAYSNKKWKAIPEAIISLPMVLPPTVLGFYLLLALSPNGPVGNFSESVFDRRLIFSFEGLVIASVIYSLPFMVQPLQTGFQSIPSSLREASYLLGKSRTETFFRVLVPNIKPSLITGMILSFAHTMGEFGVVMMIGGNLDGETKVASVAIFEQVETMNYDAANTYAVILFSISFLILVTVHSLKKKTGNDSR